MSPRPCRRRKLLFFLFLAAHRSNNDNAHAFLPSQPSQFAAKAKSNPKVKSQPPLLQSLHPRYPSSPTTSLQLGLLPPDLLLATEELAKQSANLLSSYSHLLQVHPITTKATTAAILACAGDAIAQSRSDSESYDPIRGASFLFFGALYTGAFQHFWFDYMTQNIGSWGQKLGFWGPERTSLPVDLVIDVDEWWRYFDIVSQLENPPSAQALAAAKVALNQLVVIPLVYMPLFFAFTGLVSGLDKKESVARARSLYLPLLQRNWFFWLPTQFLQFLVIPVPLQIPFVSAASLVWTIILSSIGGGTTSPSSPSQIVVYETQEDDGGEEIVTIAKVEPGAANQVTDNVSLQDVEKALIPDSLVESTKEVAADARTQLAASGLAAGLLSGSADEGAIGSAVGRLVNVEEGVGVAVVAAVGAGLGLLASASGKDEAGEDDDSVAQGEDDQTTLESSVEDDIEPDDDDDDASLLENESLQNEDSGALISRR